MSAPKQTEAWALQEAAAHLDGAMIILTSELHTLSPKLRLMYEGEALCKS